MVYGDYISWLDSYSLFSPILFCWCVTLSVMLLRILKPSSEYQSQNFPELWISERSGIKILFTLSRSPRPHSSYITKKGILRKHSAFSSLLTQSGLYFKSVFLLLLGETLVAEEQLCVQPHSQGWCVSLQPRLHSSCLCCTALRRPWDTTRPGEKIAWDYIMKDGLVVCMHKRAKLRSCSQFCNDFWLLHFSSAPTLLPIERPYFPPIFHYSVSSASSLLPIPAHLKNHVSVSVSVSCPYFDAFCIYDSHSPLLFLTVVWTNSSLPKAAVSWQIQLPPFPLCPHDWL